MLYGKDFKLEGTGLLEFNETIFHPEPDVRRLDDARNVLYRQPGEGDGDQPLYYMYRGVYQHQDWEFFLEYGVRYDITVLVSGTIEKEFIKTVGHFHPLKPNSSETYPEYYEVLSGEAIYLLQRNNRSGDVKEIIAVEAKTGDKVYIPSGYGHVTINPGETPLVMANLVERNFSSLYEPFREKHGAAYYCVLGPNRGEYVRNEHYLNSVGLQMVPAPNLPQPSDAVKGRSLYAAYMAAPSSFSFLTS